MTTAPPPVRDPAWSLPREAIGLWVTQSVIGAFFLGMAVGAFLLFVPAEVGGPIPFLRWFVPIAPWVAHSQTAERGSSQAGSRTGSAVIPAILPAGCGAAPVERWTT